MQLHNFFEKQLCVFFIHKLIAFYILMFSLRLESLHSMSKWTLSAHISKSI